jgi:hypothetical protein
MMAKIRKALIAALAGASAAAVAAAQDGQITATEWLTILGSAVVAGYAVWRIPNEPPKTNQ